MITTFKLYESNEEKTDFLDIRKSWYPDLDTPDKYEQDDFDRVKRRLADYMKNYYDLNYFEIVGIIDYENVEADSDEYGDYNTLYNILQWEPHIKVSELSDRFMKNDEGSYQLDLIKENPEKHPNYTRNKNLKKYKI